MIYFSGNQSFDFDFFKLNTSNFFYRQTNDFSLLISYFEMKRGKTCSTVTNKLVASFFMLFFIFMTVLPTYRYEPYFVPR